MTDKYDALEQASKENEAWRKLEKECRENTLALEEFNKTQEKIRQRLNTYTKEKYNNKNVEIPSEMFEFINVLYHSANTGKYPANNWLQKDGKTSDHKSMCASMFRHLAAAECQLEKDPDSGLHPLLHLAARSLMLYTRIKRGLE